MRGCVRGTPTSAKSTSGYYKYYFSAWTPSSNKYFYVWRDGTSPYIKVYYHNGTSWTTDTISSNSNAGPTVVVYNSRLYIFWKNQSTQAIQFKYYRYDGNVYGIYDLNRNGMLSSGSFDSAVFNNYLYLVYSYGGTVYLSKCTTTTCTTAGWYDFGSGVYKKSLGYSAYPGMGVDVASALNGTGAVTRLYIASADYSYPYYRIRVDQVDTSDNKTHTSYMPTNYPSYRTYPYKEIGLKAVSSAFPSATTYLYLVWKDYYSTKIYASVLQKYDDDDDSDTWFTKSVDTFLDSNTGVRFMKGDGAAVDLRDPLI